MPAVIPAKAGTGIHAFPSAIELADALASSVTNALTRHIADHGIATLAVSGGTTPVKFFQALAARQLNWAAVTITLVDDRWVPESSPRSNAGLVRQHLLQGRAAAAVFVPLVNGAETPEAGLSAADEAIAKLRPFTAVVLGMGTDGHTASFFPGGDHLAQALAPMRGQNVDTMRAEAAGEPRITLTLPVLLEAGTLALHIEGTAKRQVLDAARHPGPVEDMPIRAILARDPAPEIFWSP
jgi:6-phosphogluconolactonase